MLGTFRLFLAVLVVLQHLLSIPHLGHFAVHGFFILSGFLMTLIMHKSYGYTIGGIQGFMINRFLRLFPVYWFYIGLTLFFIFLVGEDYSKEYRHFIYFPDSIYAWLQNMTMIFFSSFPGSVEPRILPATWALTVELLFYLLIAIGLSKSKKIAKLWLIVSLSYYLLTFVLELGYQYRYNFIIAGTLPFSIGSLLYYYSDQFKKLAIKKYVVLFLLLFVSNMLLLLLLDVLNLFESIQGVFYFNNYILSALVVVVLFQFNDMSPLIKKIDKVLGDLSYPIYLSHWSVGMIVSYIFFGEPNRVLSNNGLISFLFTIIICILLGVFSSRCIDHKIEKIRVKIKKGR